MRFLRHAAIVAWKDLRVELRTREIVYTMVFFAVMVVLIFSFAFIEDGQAVGDVSSGILWIAVAFAGMLGLSRAFDREREGDTIRGLLLSPAERGALFVGKAAGIALFMLIAEAVVVPLVGVLFRAPVLAHPLELALLLILATIGFSVVGSVFAAMLIRTRMREVLLPVVFYPIVIPALIAGTKGSAALLATPSTLPVAYFWIKFLAVFDALFLSVALWAFESLVIE
ncbi:MAG: heme exporter protein CcmB [Deltaproteobacteria bacterium]|nr:heme exporter protein CcmB [Deltaproteobacteria bacterium]